MPHAFVQQPNGKIAIWSSVVDQFIAMNLTAGQAIVEELDNPLNESYPGNLREDLCRELENIARTGRSWGWAPTYNEAIEIIRDLHGDEKAEDCDLMCLS